MSGDEGTGAEGDPQADEEAADDADVEAAIEQESSVPPEETQQAEEPVDAPEAEEPVDAPESEKPVDAPEAEEPVDMPEVEEPVDAPADEEPVDSPETDQPVDTPETAPEDGGVESDARGGENAERDAEAGESDSGGTGGETIDVEVPANLLRAWEHQADKAKLSVSEYVVRMTEAGRMSVQMQPATGGEAAAMSVEQLTDEVVEQLRHEEAVPWDQLVDAISKNLEEQLEEALARLQEDDVVRYSGLKGGYRLVEEDT
jgi:hypothetical protein